MAVRFMLDDPQHQMGLPRYQFVQPAFELLCVDEERHFNRLFEAAIQGEEATLRFLQTVSRMTGLVISPQKEVSIVRESLALVPSEEPTTFELNSPERRIPDIVVTDWSSFIVIVENKVQSSSVYWRQIADEASLGITLAKTFRRDGPVMVVYLYVAPDAIRTTVGSSVDSLSPDRPEHVQFKSRYIGLREVPTWLPTGLLGDADAFVRAYLTCIARQSEGVTMDTDTRDRIRALAQSGGFEKFAEHVKTCLTEAGQAAENEWDRLRGDRLSRIEFGEKSIGRTWGGLTLKPSSRPWCPEWVGDVFISYYFGSPENLKGVSPRLDAAVQSKKTRRRMRREGEEPIVQGFVRELRKRVPDLVENTTREGWSGVVRLEILHDPLSSDMAARLAAGERFASFLAEIHNTAQPDSPPIPVAGPDSRDESS